MLSWPLLESLGVVSDIQYRTEQSVVVDKMHEEIVQLRHVVDQ